MTTADTADDRETVHGTAVAIAGAGILIRGASGMGKSDLALRLIDRGAMLISDDRVEIVRSGADVLLEIRSLGICECAYQSGVALRLIVDLKRQPERFPLDRQIMILLGIAVPSCTLDAMESSAPIKAEWALQRIMQGAGSQ